MKSRFFASSALMVIALFAAADLQAQAVPPTPTTLPSPEGTPQQQGTERVTLTGCLKQERDVPGLTSHRAERAGLGEGFVLTNARLTAIAAAPAQNPSPETPYGSESARTAPSTMYRIAGLDNEKLQALLNQHVEVTGRLESAPQPTDMISNTEPVRHAEAEAETHAGAPEDLPQIRATAIRAVSSTCMRGTS
jgi:hypothetical protein